MRTDGHGDGLLQSNGVHRVMMTMHMCVWCVVCVCGVCVVCVVCVCVCAHLCLVLSCNILGTA